jgi:hypothetical protein
MAAKSPVGGAGFANGCRALHPGRDLLEQLQPFRADAELEQSKSGEVAARPRQALDKAGADRVADHGEHDRQGAGGLLQRHHRVVAAGQKDVRTEREELRDVSAHTLGIAAAPADIDLRVAPVGPAQLLQPLRNAARRACPSGPSAATLMSTPMRRMRAGCCARAAIGHAAVPPRRVMNSRRLMKAP